MDGRVIEKGSRGEWWRGATELKAKKKLNFKRRVLSLDLNVGRGSLNAFLRFVLTTPDISHNSFLVFPSSLFFLSRLL